MRDLQYRVGIGFKTELEVGECTIYRHDASTPEAPVWIFAFRFTRNTDGKPETRRLPINPGTDAPGDPSRGWGLKRVSAGRWQVTPSIKCLERVVGDDGKKVDVETWHDNVEIVGVPDDEPWTKGH